MTFTLPSTTGLLVLAIAAALVGVLVLAAGATAFFVRNHAIRVAREQSIPTYYRQLALAH